MKFKLLSGVLAAATVLTLFTSTAFAAGDHPDHVTIAPNPTISARPMSDLPESHWAFEAAKTMVEQEIMDLNEQNLFVPDGNFTRESLVLALWRMSGKPDAKAELTFTDVEADSPAAEAIRWAAEAKIVNGYDETHFGPRDSITREQMAKMIYVFVQQYDMGFKGAWMFHLSYEDADQISEWAFEPVMWMVASRIFQGVTETQLLPQGTVTRAQAAVMLTRLLETAAEKDVSFSK